MTVGFVGAVVAGGEELLVHAHPHWRALVRPALVTVVGAGLAGIACGLAEIELAPGTRHLAWLVLGGLYGLGVLAWAVRPVVRWARTDLVVTDRRVVFRPAGSRRYLLDLPLGRVSAVRFRHTLGDRALGTGTLILECGYLPPVEIHDVPQIARVHAVVYDELDRQRAYARRT